MNRLLAGLVAAAVVVVTGCAGQDPTRQTLNEQVDSIRDAAAAGDLDAAQRELDQLQALVRQAVQDGELDQQRADAILGAAAAVDQELSTLAQPAPPPPTEGQPPDRDGDDDERDEDDKDKEQKDEEDEEGPEKEEPDEDEDEDD